jgi:hypothetical protein
MGAGNIEWALHTNTRMRLIVQFCFCIILVVEAFTAIAGAAEVLISCSFSTLQVPDLLFA